MKLFLNISHQKSLNSDSSIILNFQKNCQITKHILPSGYSTCHNSEMTYKKLPYSELSLLVIGILGRAIPHLPNMTPMGAVFLVSGLTIQNPFLSLAIPMISLLLGDVWFAGLHTSMVWVYGAFALILILGRALKNHLSLPVLAMISSLLFFILTNIGVWISGGLYPHTLAGLYRCFVMALPFFRNAWAGDLIYTYLIFYAVKTLMSDSKKISLRQHT